MEKIKIIFIDIDGVLNSNRYYTSDDNPERHNLYDDYGDSFCPLSAGLLNKLIKTTGAKVVVSSSWRHQGFEKMKQMWIDRKMEGEVIGITPSFRAAIKSQNLLKDYNEVSIPRGLEIQWYYQTKHNFRHWNWDGEYVQAEKAKCTLDTYVIFDDDSDMLYEQRNNFVHCNHANGLMEEQYDQAIRILSSTIE